MNKNKKQVLQLKNILLSSGKGALAKAFLAAFLLISATGFGSAQTAMVTENFVSYPSTGVSNYQCDVAGALPTSGDSKNRSFYTTSLTDKNGVASSDPWKNSALIEFDQTTQTSFMTYPAGCLTFCGEVSCSNPVRKVQGPDSTGIFMEDSGPFPIQSIFFEVFKYQKNGNPLNPDSTPPIRTIALYPTDEASRTCNGVAAVNPKKSTDPKSESCCNRCDFARNTCITKGYCGTVTTAANCNAKGTIDGVETPLCTWNGDRCIDAVSCSSFNQTVCSGAASTACKWNVATSSTPPSECASTCENFAATAGDNATRLKNCNDGITKLSFCAAWDGMYEIDGEFGKSNGQFGFRTTIQTNWKGDGVQTPEIDITHMIAYPGQNQIPIQVDVTNVHSVRSSTSLVGAKTAVSAQPYYLLYRLSKDALMTINIKDPDASAATALKRALLKNFPSLGEGTPGGADKIDTVTTESIGWDGRDDEGLLLPYGNYNVDFSANSKDEWTGIAGTDQSRTITRQLSLDPLKITDLVSAGLNKTSTAYAMLSYMTTESATVYANIYTPGTSFGSIEIGSNAALGAAPTITPNSGSLVQSIVEQKSGRITTNTKWDGMCRAAAGCKIGSVTYPNGAPLPDGDYVYVVWAEMPYPTGTERVINGKTWNGVKTRIYHNGILSVDRGNPDIELDPVVYSTIGSSPTAFGLDPFIIQYSLSRPATVTAKITTTSIAGADADNAGEVVLVKTLVNNEIQGSTKKNNYTWDGRDDNGRYVSPGNYLLEVTAKDTMFPDKQVTRVAQFPVDLFRVVDVEALPILGEATSQASVSYALSKSMDVTLNIYDKNVVIPNPKTPGVTWPPVACTSAQLSATQPTCMYKMNGNTKVVLEASDLLKTYAGQRPGEGQTVIEFWDGLLYSNGFAGSQDVMSDGMYPYYISAVANVQSSIYYTTNTSNNPVAQKPVFANSLTATDRPAGYITIARGPVYFNSILINPSKPKLYYSSETVFIPTYEVQFSVTRTANITVEIRSLTQGACLTPTTPSGSVCRTLTRTAAAALGTIYDPIVVNKLYWDGKDEKGEYVATDAYEVRFVATPYPLPNGVSADSVCADSTNAKYCTQESRIINVNNFQVFDRYIWDVSPGNGSMGKFAYQISVPMKVAIQIFKPGTKISNVNDGTLVNPANPAGAPVTETTVKEVLVKAIIGMRPNLIAVEDIWDGTDYAGNKVPDGEYAFRYVTVTDPYDMDSITGAVIAPDQISVQNKVADWDKFINLGSITVANGDSMFADIDWKSNKVTSFFPNPLRKGFGQFEITKVPAPGTVTIKIFNIAGDLVRDSGYECMNARGVTASLEYINDTGGLTPDWTASGPDTGNDNITGGRNFTLRCKWDRTNNHGKQVARGLYYAIMELSPTMGNSKKVQKIVKILIP